MRIAGLSLPLGCVAIASVLAACSGGAGGGASSGSAAATGTDAGTPAKTRPPTGGGDGGAATAGDACLGASLPITIAGGLPYAKATVGRAPQAGVGSFMLDLATTLSTIDLAAFGSGGPQPTNCDPTLLGQRCSFHGFDFFGDWGDVVLVTADHAGYGAGVVRPAGILGTNMLSQIVLTLDYAGETARRATADAFCDDDALRALGLAPLSSAGFYASDPKQLRDMTSVMSDATPGVHVPNVPSVPLRIGGATAPAQLDTGFDDYLYPLSINVNEAFYAAIVKASPDALVRASSRDLSLSTCAGVSEPVEAYTLAAGKAAALVDEDGNDAFSAADATVFVKRTPAAARRCGGIGTWTAPAAQVGGTLFARVGTTVFDPFTSRVWVKKTP